MFNLGLLETQRWLEILSVVLLIIGFYFTFNFFEYLKSDEDRLRKQAKIAALICIAGAFLIPIFYNILDSYYLD
ncbi:hypothetical protein AUC31_14550 [Planococcus rifietoensis]|uniref:Uncharacterized protein n=1 Tax=Planococcus rifietoensis TaxID=200991 RepID=A0A0U2ZAJ3_9BACL|nr:hypothetical protein [Planococcus rifietoensis]ALS76340.1 hypothetical protein AUC31_14550 [Planococcus rifietoensis]